MGSFINSWGSVASYTITLAGLASSATIVAGRNSTALDYSGLNLTDVHVTGRVTTIAAGALTAGVIEVWAYGCLDDTPTYPLGVTATDANFTVLTRDMLYAAFGGAFQRPLVVISTETTNARSYDFGPISLAQHFGGEVPKLGGIFVVHNTGQALHATGGLSFIKYRPIFKAF